MVRRLFGVLAVAVVLCLGAVLADEITGTVTKVDTAKKTVTVKGEDGKEATYECAFDVKVTRGFGGKGGGGGGKRGEPPPPGTLETLQETLEGKAGARGVPATLTRDDTTKKVTQIKATFGRRGGGQ